MDIAVRDIGSTRPDIEEEVESRVVVLVIVTEVDVDVVVEALPELAAPDSNMSASAGLLERNAAAKLPIGQPRLHGFDLQQPRKGGEALAHV